MSLSVSRWGKWFAASALGAPALKQWALGSLTILLYTQFCYLTAASRSQARQETGEKARVMLLSATAANSPQP